MVTTKKILELLDVIDIQRDIIMVMILEIIMIQSIIIQVFLADVWIRLLMDDDVLCHMIIGKYNFLFDNI